MRKLLIAAAVLLALLFVLAHRQHAAVETGPDVAHLLEFRHDG